MIFKQGVKLQGLSSEIVMAALVADNLWRENGRNEGATITSVVDGVHSKRSLHYVGKAIDLRTRYFTEGKKRQIFAELKSRLTDEFDVVWHQTHIHIEFDPKTPAIHTYA